MLCWKTLDNRPARPGALKAHFTFTFGGQRFAYCRIRKNGCSAIQQFIIDSSPYKVGNGKYGYKFLRKYHRVRSIQELESADHRILIFRDPVERIQSLYLNKFLQREGCGDIFRSYRTVTGKDPGKATFDDFIIDYVSRIEDVTLDPHVWPQHWHLCNVVYDRVFPLNSLRESMARIVGPEMASRFFNKKINPSTATTLSVGAEMRARISKIYADDFRMIQRITDNS